MKVLIFIETGNKTTNEYCFVNQNISHIKLGVEIEIICVGGKDKLKYFLNRMADNIREGGINLVIFDCDSIKIGGGIENRKKEMEKLRKEVKFEYFFFPNNSDEGTFETLLEHIINKEHKGILECFRGYEMCISGRDDGRGIYVTPNEKAKMYAYIEAFKQTRDEKNEMKKGNWHFNDKRYWDLDDQYLEPLKSFLTKYL